MLQESYQTKSPRLLQVRKVLDRFLIKQGENVYLERALRSKIAQKTQRKVGDGLESQLAPFLKEEKIGEIRNRLSKLTDDEIIYSIIAEDFVSLDQKILSLPGFFQWASEIGGQKGLDTQGINAVFSLTDPDYLRYLRQHQDWLVTTVDTTTKKWLANYISSGFEEGLDNKEIVRTIADQVGGIGRLNPLARAELIVESETTWAMSQTEQEFYVRNGIQTKRWEVIPDERLCPFCLPNGTQGNIPINDKFLSGHTAPPAHNRCRCILTTDEQIDLEELADRLWKGQAQPFTVPNRGGAGSVTPYINERNLGFFRVPMNHYREWVAKHLENQGIGKEAVDLVRESEIHREEVPTGALKDRVSIDIADDLKVEEYARKMTEGAKFPSAVLMVDPYDPGRWLVYEGNHRLAAAIKLNPKSITVLTMELPE